MPPVNNVRAYNKAVRKGWYCRFDHELKETLTCEKEHPDAKPDLIRALAMTDPGPSTLESIAEKLKMPRKSGPSWP